MAEIKGPEHGPEHGHIEPEIPGLGHGHVLLHWIRLIESVRMI